MLTAIICLKKIPFRVSESSAQPPQRSGRRSAPPPYASVSGTAVQVHRWALVALAFSIPLLYPMQNICIAVACAAWLFSGQAADARRRIGERSAVVWWMLLLAWTVMSLLWSADIAEGVGDVTRKSSFLIMPLVVGAAWGADRALLERCYAAFVLGVLAAGSFSIIATAINPQGYMPDAFFYDWLVRHLDDIAVSAAWKCLLALTILVLHNFEGTVFRKPAWRHAVFAGLFVYFVLLCAKTLLVLGTAILLAILLGRVVLQRGKRVASTAMAVFMLATLFTIWSLPESHLRKRFGQVSSAAVTADEGVADIRSANNYDKRMAVWTAAWQNLTDGTTWLTGTGIGDAQAAQDQRVWRVSFSYKSYPNLYELHDYKVDNMYLQTWLGLGIPGLLILGALLTCFFFGAVRKRLAVPAVFVAVSAFFFLQESMLQSQTGIVAFSFFTCLWAAVYRMRMNPLTRLR